MISVVVPVYNIKKYISKCIESIIKQTYTDIEVILVDDGSTDGSGEICDKYAQLDARIQVVHKENGGLSDARNVAIDIAKGQQITFVDGDDYIHPRMLEILLQILNEQDADIVTCRFRTVEEDENVICEGILNNASGRLFGSDEAISNLADIGATAWCKLYCMELFQGIRYPKGRYHEDEYVIHELLFKAKGIVAIETELYYYVQRRGSITAEINLRKVEDAIDAYRERLCFAEEKNWAVAYKSTVLIFVNYLYVMSLKLDGTLSRKHRKKIRLYMRTVIRKSPDIEIPRIQVLYAYSEVLHDCYLVMGKMKSRITGR